MLSAIRFSKKIAKIRAKIITRIGVRPKIKVDFKIKIEVILLVNLVDLWKLTNLDCTDLKETKPNIELLKGFFLHSIILLILIKLFFK